MHTHATRAEEFFRAGEPEEALARARHALRAGAARLEWSADADELARLIRQRAARYRRAITRRREAIARRASMRAAREGVAAPTSLRTPGLALDGSVPAMARPTATVTQ